MEWTKLSVTVGAKTVATSTVKLYDALDPLLPAMDMEVRLCSPAPATSSTHPGTTFVCLSSIYLVIVCVPELPLVVSRPGFCPMHSCLR